MIKISQQPVLPLQCSVLERNLHLPLKSLERGVGQGVLMGAALWVNKAQYWAITDMGVLPGCTPLGWHGLSYGLFPSPEKCIC